MNCPQASCEPSYLSSGQNPPTWSFHSILAGPAQLSPHPRLQRDISETQRIDHVLKQLKNLPWPLHASSGKKITLQWVFYASSSTNFFSHVSHCFCKNSSAPWVLKTCSFSYIPCSLCTQVHLPAILCPGPLYQVNCTCAF